jgi:hypothetical protein
LVRKPRVYRKMVSSTVLSVLTFHEESLHCIRADTAVQAVKVASLETEVGKLVWKQSKERLGKLETVNAVPGKSINGLEVALASAEAQSTSASSALTKAGGAIVHMYDRAVIHMTDRDVRA